MSAFFLEPIREVQISLAVFLRVFRFSAAWFTLRRDQRFVESEGFP
jgi:hypothetical protein